jgi:hypothetical protein
MSWVCSTVGQTKRFYIFEVCLLVLIRIIVVRHTSYNVDDLKAPSSAINK